MKSDYFYQINMYSNNNFKANQKKNPIFVISFNTCNLTIKNESILQYILLLSQN